jgi:hypothetical protein
MHFRGLLPPGPLLFLKAFGDAAYRVLAYLLTRLYASVIPAILRIEIPERYISRMASSKLPVIRL